MPPGEGHARVWAPVLLPAVLFSNAKVGSCAANSAVAALGTSGGRYIRASEVCSFLWQKMHIHGGYSEFLAFVLGESSFENGRHEVLPLKCGNCYGYFFKNSDHRFS